MSGPVNRTGLYGAASIPPGAVVKAASWHIAGHYGPSVETFPTEQAALAAGIESLIDAYQAPGVFPPGHLTIDLRWMMEWPPGTRDANGEISHASGREFTVTRTTYETLSAAKEHLERLERIYGPVS